MSGFEGSYLGANDRIGPAAVMECKICWTPYDPAMGDDFRQILPGTPFTALPEDWSCPHCGAPKNQFMVLSDPEADAVSAAVAERVARLVADFEDVWHGKMRDVPLVNKALHVEAVGFRLHEGRPLGVLVAPWFMNLVLLPAEGEDWSTLAPGEKEIIAFPSGDYEFLHNVRPMGGGYKACSLFSPMNDFSSQLQAVEVARAVMAALFDPQNRAETDRAAEIRAAREADLAPLAADPEPSRRAVITAGLGQAG
ncbi:[NiFe]-hydrogenase assembly chaperone HybE [Cereibacter sphaeroides]|jgi:[NiFe] hydrogenase assembly HybE family chaperone|uniref:[NiFe]-hydrogenase assembly chaperone HybE n=1 Tax=Cereibacter sphaeroides TaxID=1063 RepID=UPI0000664E45|nr:Rubredoxin-type Fe(Cys)4 protein [Cereibacter sphaeroides ATCC 17029]